MRSRAQAKTANETHSDSNPASTHVESNPRGSSTKNAKKPRTISEPTEPQLGPVWEHTDSGWWVVEQNGMLRTGPFKDKEQARGWFYKELDIKLSI